MPKYITNKVYLHNQKNQAKESKKITKFWLFTLQSIFRNLGFNLLKKHELRQDTYFEIIP